MTYLVMGLGVSGQSVCEYLSDMGKSFWLYDDNQDMIQQAQTQFPNAKHFTQNWSEVDTVVASPGLPLDNPMLQAARQLHKTVICDVALFMSQAKKPMVVITGTNGKSTTTTLVAAVLNSMGHLVFAGGNLGIPVLQGLKKNYDYYILELSSFQLELTPNLHSKAACLLNVTPDHLDRYDNFQAYIKAKQMIYQNTEVKVYNRDDAYTQLNGFDERFSFGLLPSVGFYQQDGWLLQGERRLMPIADIALQGQHQWSNVMAAYALVLALDLDITSVSKAVKQFKGLAHRAQILNHASKVWVNDSKATNIGALEATLNGFQGKRIIWLGGGQAKGQDFSEIGQSLQNRVSRAILMGEDAKMIAKSLKGFVPCMFAGDMESAVREAHALSDDGDVILLSPACASFDMFKNYSHRGEAFERAVKSL